MLQVATLMILKENDLGNTLYNPRRRIRLSGIPKTKAMSTKRERIKNKFCGLCAYTGKPLGDDWQIDHMESVAHCRWNGKSDKANLEENLIPALRIVNHYKRSHHLESFRRYMLNFHKRLKKLPQKTRVAKTEKRKEYMYKVADAFGITPEKPFDGLFYFEKQKEA